VLGADAGALLSSGRKQRTAGKGSCATEQSARALVDSCDGLLAEQLLLAAGDLQMMCEIGGHVVALQRLEVSSSHDAGGERAEVWNNNLSTKEV